MLFSHSFPYRTSLGLLAGEHHAGNRYLHLRPRQFSKPTCSSPWHFFCPQSYARNAHLKQAHPPLVQSHRGTSVGKQNRSIFIDANL